jgi:hypothetical protein
MLPVREQEFDAPWKEALDLGFDLFLGLFLPDVYAILDWTRDHEPLEQELQKLTPESATGVRRVDKLVKAFRTQTRDPRFLHVEAQAQRDPSFGERLYTYNYRGRDHFGQPLISIAVFGDPDPDWHPKEHREGELGSEVVFTFRTVKLLEWAGRQQELEEGENLFGLFVCAHLVALAAQPGDEARAEGKRRLLGNLVGRGLSALETGQWYRLIDWILPLTADQERRVREQVRQLREGEAMPFVSFIEQEAREEGKREGLLRSLRALLKAKFGADGEALLAQLPEETLFPRLEELLIQVGMSTSLEVLRPHFIQTDLKPPV